jgi:hypothetical protein
LKALAFIVGGICAQFKPVNVAYGSIATEIGCPRHVRFSPDSDRRTGHRGCLKRARNGNDQTLACGKTIIVFTVCRNRPLTRPASKKP